MMKFTMDLHRIPDKVQAVMDAMIDDLIDISIQGLKTFDISVPGCIPSVGLIMERGGGFYYPLKIFERFEVPYLKKIVEAMVKEGITPILTFSLQGEFVFRVNPSREKGLFYRRTYTTRD